MSLQPSLVPVPDMSGQVAIVTGASRGIGKAIALRLAEAGALVVVAAKSERSRDLLPGSIHETVDEIVAAGGQAQAMKVDLRDEAQVTDMIEATLKEHGRVDLLVNNAGVQLEKTMADTTEEDWDWLMGINLKGLFLCSRAAIRLMASLPTSKASSSNARCSATWRECRPVAGEAEVARPA